MSTSAPRALQIAIKPTAKGLKLSLGEYGRAADAVFEVAVDVTALNMDKTLVRLSQKLHQARFFDKVERRLEPLRWPVVALVLNYEELWPVRWENLFGSHLKAPSVYVRVVDRARAAARFHASQGIIGLKELVGVDAIIVSGTPGAGRLPRLEQPKQYLRELLGASKDVLVYVDSPEAFREFFDLLRYLSRNTRGSVPLPLPDILQTDATGFLVPDRSGPLEPVRGVLYPRLLCASEAIEPGERVTFILGLEATGPVDLEPVVLGFPQDTATTILRAVVSSSDFECPEGESWVRSFVVDRRLVTRPRDWEFSARPLGERLAYALTVTFINGGAPVGSYQLRIRRKNAPALEPAEARLVRLTSRPPGDHITLSIAADGTRYQLCLLRNDRELTKTLSWNKLTEPFFSKLEVAKGFDEIKELGWGLHLSLPSELRAALAKSEIRTLPLMIVSVGPVAPFEVVRVDRHKPDSILGLERPVLRWTDDTPMPERTRLSLAGVVCIRPEYCGDEALPSAAEEERLLQMAFMDRYQRVARRADFENALAREDTLLVHFAGHADGNPAMLSLEDEKITPTQFDPAQPLMLGGPFMFLNGCRAAQGRVHEPEFQANMLKVLLEANCTGAVAPLVKVQSRAALDAARIFYQSVKSGRTVGEAVLDIRLRGREAGVPLEDVPSYFSYLAYSSPQLRLKF